jgi:hypothetical protein
MDWTRGCWSSGWCTGNQAEVRTPIGAGPHQERLSATRGDGAVRAGPRRDRRPNPGRRSVVTEPVVRAGGGIVWRRGEGSGVEIVLVHRPAYARPGQQQPVADPALGDR